MLDATRCNDISARAGIGVFTQQFGPKINRYAFQDIPKLKALILKVIEWVRKTPHNYDHRWINLQGLGIVEKDSTGKNKQASSGPPEELSLIHI